MALRTDHDLPTRLREPFAVGVVILWTFEAVLFFSAVVLLFTADRPLIESWSAPGWRELTLGILAVLLIVIGRRAIDRWLLRFRAGESGLSKSRESNPALNTDAGQPPRAG